MRALIESIKRFLIEIQPQIEAAKNEVPEVPTTEDKIEQIGTLEMADKLMEEVEQLVEIQEPLAENGLTPTEIGLSVEVKEGIIEDETLKKELELANQTIAELKATVDSLQTELSIVKKEELELKSALKEEFSLSANKGKATNLTPKDYLRQKLKNHIHKI